MPVSTTNIEVCVLGGTVGTDFAVLVPAGPPGSAGPANPLPVASTKQGWIIYSGSCKAINNPPGGALNWLSSEWDDQCSAASMTTSVTTFP